MGLFLKKSRIECKSLPFPVGLFFQSNHPKRHILYLPDFKSTTKITNLYYRRPPGTPNWMKIDEIMKGHVQQFWGREFLAKKHGRTLGHKGLVKHNEIIQDHKNTSFDTLKLFSDSYSTI